MRSTPEAAEVMTYPRLSDVLRETGVPDLIEILAERLSAAELETVLREAHHQRAGRVLPATLLAEYERDARFQPAPARGAALPAIDRIALDVAAPPFEPLDLSPICPIGTVAGLSPVDPGTALGVAGMGELVSDSAAVLALEAARRRRDAPGDQAAVRLCASHRELHVPFSGPWSDPHTRVFTLCTAGEDEGAFRFEIRSLREQIEIHLRLLQGLRQEGYAIGIVTVALARRPGPELDEILGAGGVAPLTAAFPDVRFVIDGAPARHFAPVGFTVVAEDRAEVEHLITFGGCTDWTRRLLGRGDERLVVSRVATERVGEAFGGAGTDWQRRGSGEE